MQYRKNGQRYSQQSYSESTMEIVPLIYKVEGLVPLTWRKSCQYFRKWLIDWWFVLVLWGSPHFSNHPEAAARPSIRKKQIWVCQSKDMVTRCWGLRECSGTHGNGVTKLPWFKAYGGTFFSMTRITHEIRILS